jgi:DNA-binding MurR/RpiR family transcriptional regulator
MAAVRSGTAAGTARPEKLDDLRALIATGQLDAGGKLESVARFMLENPSDVAFLSAQKIARRCGVSATSVQRLAYRLGYDSYTDFRGLFRRAIRK